MRLISTLGALGHCAIQKYIYHTWIEGVYHDGMRRRTDRIQGWQLVDSYKPNCCPARSVEVLGDFAVMIDHQYIASCQQPRTQYSTWSQFMAPACMANPTSRSPGPEHLAVLESTHRRTRSTRTCRERFVIAITQLQTTLSTNFQASLYVPTVYTANHNHQ